ncbi:MAG: tetratricopeptide repeat protein [Candidatus Omnitrophica bacterium]|nr:tetratricopeptide repeat protein [Candidatus Omnitrophota bacterium]
MSRNTVITHFFLSAFLILVGFILYIPVLHGPFQFDDYEFIVGNPAIRHIDRWRDIWNLLSQPSRFIAFYSFALNYHFHQLNSFGYHLTNIILHIVNVHLVWLLAHLLFRQFFSFMPTIDYRRARGMIYVAALLFLVHPLQTQAVSYITQRFESLATFFYLSSFVFYILGREAWPKRKGIIFWILSGLMAVLGMFTKETLITLPIMILFYEYCLCSLRFPGQIKRILNWRLLPVVAFLLIIPKLFSWRFIYHTTFVNYPSFSHHGDTITLYSYLLTQARVFVTFLKLIFFPIGQNLDYDFPLSYHFWDIRFIASILVLLLMVVWAIRSRKNNFFIFFGILWFFITLSANLVPRIFIIFEHKMYLAGIGLYIAFSFILFKEIKDYKKLILTTIIIVLTLGYLTMMRNRVWQSETALWEDVIKKSPQKTRPYIHLGFAYDKEGKFDQAIAVYDKLLAIYPSNFKGLNNRAAVYVEKGEYDLALRDYNLAETIDPNQWHVFFNKAKIYLVLNDKKKALDAYTKAITIAPKEINLYNERGLLYYNLGNHEAAFRDFRLTTILDPNFIEGFYNLAAIFQAKKEYGLAIRYFDKVLSLDKTLEDAYLRRGMIYHEQKNYPKAIEDMTAYIALKPASGYAYFMRGRLYMETEQQEKAYEDLKKARELGKNVKEDYFQLLEEKFGERQPEYKK